MKDGINTLHLKLEAWKPPPIYALFYVTLSCYVFETIKQKIQQDNRRYMKQLDSFPLFLIRGFQSHVTGKFIFCATW